MTPENAAIWQHLQSLYERNKAPVAFIDESYRFSRGVEGPDFYLMAGSVIESDLIAQIRMKLDELVGVDYWHTTDAFARHDLDKIRELLDYCANHLHQYFVFVGGLGPEATLESYRRQCFFQLLTRLEYQGCYLIVFEKRKRLSETNGDLALIKLGKSNGFLSRDLRVLPASPASEHLLWAPDLASWALRRMLAAQDARWLRLVLGTATFVDASPVKEKKPGRAAAKGPGPEDLVGLKGEENPRSSSASMPWGGDKVQSISKALENQGEPLIEPNVLAQLIDSRFKF